jgi:transposase
MEPAAVIQISPQMRVLVAVEAVDFRKGIDGLARVVREALSRDPFSGAVYIFRNRRRTAVKVLVYDGQGFWLALKRLSASKFRYWPDGPGRERTLEAPAAQVLLSAGDFEAVRGAQAWRRVEPPAP